MIGSLLLLLAAVATSTHAQPLAGPNATVVATVHDVCTSRHVVQVRPGEMQTVVSLNASYATTCDVESGELCGNCTIERDIWLEYVAPCTGTVRVDTCKTLQAVDSFWEDEYVDTQLQVFLNDCPTNSTRNAALGDDALECDDYGELSRYLNDSDYGGCGTFGGGPEEAAVRVTRGDKVIARVGLWLDPDDLTIDDDTLAAPYVVTFSCESASNDVCTGRSPLLPGTSTGNELSTSCNASVGEFCSTCDIEHDQWYAWRAPCTGLATIDTCDWSNAVRMELFKGGCPTASTKTSVNGKHVCEAAHDDDFWCHGETQSVFVRKDEEVVVRVGTAPQSMQQISGGSFRVSCNPDATPLVNDDCSNGTLVALGARVRVNTTLATSCTLCGDCTMPRDLWYTVRATCTGSLRIDGCSLSSARSVLVAAHNSTCPDPTNIRSQCGAVETQACTSRGSASSGFLASVSVRADDLVNVRIGGLSEVTGSFAVACVSAPSNDACQGAAPFAANGTAFVDNTNATACAAGTCGFCSIERDVWFVYTANCTGTAVIDTCSVEGDTELALHRDVRCAFGSRTFNEGGPSSCNDYDTSIVGGAAVACGDHEHAPLGERASISVAAGDRIVVRVGSHVKGKVVHGHLHALCLPGPTTTTTTAATTTTATPTTTTETPTTTPIQCPPCTVLNGRGVCVDRCRPVACSNFVAGWNGNTCEAYAANAESGCNERGECVAADDVSQCLGIEVAPLVTCGDEKCVTKSACQRGSLALGSSSPLALCSAGTEARCGTGFTCSNSGTCTAVSSVSSVSSASGAVLSAALAVVASIKLFV